MESTAAGRALRVAADEATVEVVTRGASLRSFVAAGRELLDGFAAGEAPTQARGQPLLPWPNRIREGRYRWDGEEHQLVITEPERNAALHGLTRDVLWEVDEHAGATVALVHTLDEPVGYPFTVALTVAYTLSDDGLVVTTTARNVGKRPAPYGTGHHPFLRPATGTIDGCTLQVAGAGSGRPIGDAVLDQTVSGLDRDSQQRAWVRMTDAHGRGAALWMDAAYRHVQLYTGDTLPRVDERRRGLAVEPMTCPPNAFSTGTDVIRLEPGQSVTTRWGLRPIGD